MKDPLLLSILMLTISVGWLVSVLLMRAKHRGLHQHAASLTVTINLQVKQLSGMRNQIETLKLQLEAAQQKALTAAPPTTPPPITALEKILRERDATFMVGGKPTKDDDFPDTDVNRMDDFPDTDVIHRGQPN